MSHKATNRGLFITVEGIDGAGKSTHITFIREFLENIGHKVITTREPGGTPCGEMIRDVLLHKAEAMHRMTELFLLLASRQELIHNVIVPNLNQGICVLADRFIDSSIAYQAGGRNLGISKVKQALALLEPEIKPDLTFIFDVELSIATRRLHKNAKQDRIERENSEFFVLVQDTYHQIAKMEPERVKLINTAQEKQTTRAELASYLTTLISGSRPTPG